MRGPITAFALVASATLAVCLPLGCGDSSEERVVDGNSGVTPCEGTLRDRCGGECFADEQCELGLYCGNDSRCTAQCTPSGGQCAESEICTERGRCQPGGIGLDDGGTGGTGGTSGDAALPDGCAKFDLTFEKQTPTVVLLIDQSGSMSDDFGGSPRWDVVHDALMDPSTGIVARLENEVRFGLALYTSNGGFSGGACPLLKTEFVRLGNYAAIEAVYAPEGPAGDTPTGESIDVIARQLAPYPQSGPKVIVLATDGEPDTCAVPNPQQGQPEAVAAAQNAHSLGIDTYIISVGDGISLGHMQDMANAGQGLPVGGSQNADYYLANDQAQLATAFETIIYGVRSCVFRLNGQVDAERANEGSVYLDGNELGFEDPNGWRLSSPTEVEILGTACESIKQGNHTVTGDFPCGVVTVPR